MPGTIGKKQLRNHPQELFRGSEVFQGLPAAKFKEGARGLG